MGSETCTAHAWEHRPDASGLRIERFECCNCHAWGRRHWTPHGLGGLRQYQRSHAPNPRWFELRCADATVDARNADDREDEMHARHGEPVGFARAAFVRGLSFRRVRGERAPATI